MFRVHMTRSAEDDIAAILHYLLSQQAGSAAEALWNSLEEALNSLHEWPLRGHVPPELAEFPDKHIREIHVDVYRVMYRIADDQVFVLFIADRRRDIQKALLDRALRFGL